MRTPPLLILTACILLMIGCTDAEPVPDDGGPNFSLETHTGDTFRLADHRGDIVIVNFWATWCTPCIHEMPLFVELQNRFNEDVQFVGVSMDQQGFDVVRPFAERLEINYPLVVDDGTVSDLFGPPMGLPTTVVLDRKGEVRERFMGLVSEEDLTALIEDVMATMASL